ncbi:MAG TPA: ParB/RepB/Spo0J family partition protein [Candidatus Acidoferrales bacterium]|nr:ParB/RepB/Spo0J family partition protein [Candidatus Acidoferrales bacterium]
MSVAKRGLGRGLGALLGDAPAAAGGAPPAGPAHLHIDAIKPNPRQPRTVFEPDAMAELEESIRQLGVLVPIIVRRRGSDYELVAGERRWRAAAAAGLQTIPAIVREADDRESLEVAIVENVLREDLDPLEEAMGYANLIEEHGYTQERLAERLGKGRPTVTNALRLLTLSEEIKAALRSGALSAGHARALLSLPPEQRARAATRIVTEGLSVRAVERLAAVTAVPKAGKTRRTPGRSPDLEQAEQNLRYRLGAQVTIEPGTRGGRIAIRYTDEHDLIRLVDLLTPES